MMVEFKTQYGMRNIDPEDVDHVKIDGNLTVIWTNDWSREPDEGRFGYIVSDSYSEAMRKLSRHQ